MAKKIRNPHAFKGLSTRETREILMDMGKGSMDSLMDVRVPSGLGTEHQDILDVLDYFNDYKKTNKLTELSPEDMSRLKGSYLKDRLAIKRADSAWDDEHGRKQQRKIAEETAKREAGEKAAREAAEKTAKETAEAAAKKLALQQTTKESAKQLAKNVGKGVLKGVGAVAGAPAVATALTAAELADIGINVGVSDVLFGDTEGESARLGRTRAVQGEEAAYNQWAASQPVDRVIPTYKEYLSYLEKSSDR
tara:strand:+ start:1126 stop:1875 length:750 start_codon:yes stop_codon:yes gene_type:complete